MYSVAFVRLFLAALYCTVAPIVETVLVVPTRTAYVSTVSANDSSLIVWQARRTHRGGGGGLTRLALAGEKKSTVTRKGFLERQTDMCVGRRYCLYIYI